MKSPHSLIPLLPSLLNHLRLPSVLSSAGPRTSLCSLGPDPTENTISIIIAQYLDCCLLIRCRGNLFTESLPVSAIPAFRHHVTILKLRDCEYTAEVMLVADTDRRWGLAARRVVTLVMLQYTSLNDIADVLRSS
jgi:hypothetical protein